MNFESNECVICLDDLNDDDDVIRLMCEHKMHSKCLLEMLSATTHKLHKCPICRKFISMRSVVNNVYNYDRIINKILISVVFIFVSIMTTIHFLEINKNVVYITTHEHMNKSLELYNDTQRT